MMGWAAALLAKRASAMSATLTQCILSAKGCGWAGGVGEGGIRAGDWISSGLAHAGPGSVESVSP